MGVVISNAEEGGKFLSRYHEQHMNRIIEEYVPNSSFANGDLIPVLDEPLDIAASEALYNTVQLLSGDGGDGVDTEDVTEVDYVVGETRVRVFLFRRSVSYSWVDIQRGALAQRNGSRINMLDMATKAAMRGIFQDANRYAALGRRGSATGLLNNENSLPQAVAFNPYSPTATADDIYDFVTDAITTIMEEMEIEEEADEYSCNTIVFPIGMRKILINNKVSGTNTSLLNTLKADYPNVDKITFTGLCRGENLAKFSDAPANEDRMAFYSRNLDVMQRQVSDVIPLPPAWDGEKYRQLFVHACSATSISYPGFVKVLKFPNV
jgi:hypothetical protein